MSNDFRPDSPVIQQGLTFYGDYHTHTHFSDGKGTPQQNIAKAYSLGYKNIAITDHSFRNPFCLTRRSFKQLSAEIDAERKKYGSDLNILLGIEADPLTTGGRIDVPKHIADELDVLLFGYHAFTRTGNFRSYRKIHFTSHMTAYGFKPTQRTIDRNTKIMLRCLQNNDIDIFVHINDKMIVNTREIANACADLGVYLELNEKHVFLLKDNIEDLLATPVKFIVNSDGHTPEKVGEYPNVCKFINQYNIPPERIANMSETVKFRRNYNSIRQQSGRSATKLLYAALQRFKRVTNVNKTDEGEK